MRCWNTMQFWCFPVPVLWGQRKTRINPTETCSAERQEPSRSLSVSDWTVLQGRGGQTLQTQFSVRRMMNVPDEALTFKASVEELLLDIVQMRPSCKVLLYYYITSIIWNHFVHQIKHAKSHFCCCVIRKP